MWVLAIHCGSLHMGYNFKDPIIGKSKFTNTHTHTHTKMALLGYTHFWGTHFWGTITENSVLKQAHDKMSARLSTRPEGRLMGSTAKNSQ